MRKLECSQRLDLLTTPVFLVGLALLLLNDWVWKAEYGNWLTGKLSDFTGLFVFAVFWTAIFPKYKRFIFILVAAFFVSWKSPFSQFLIDGWNSLGLWRIGRVVDYSDLMALIMLLPAFVFCNHNPVLSLKISPILPFLIACFAFAATSKSPIPVAFDQPYLLSISKNDFEAGLQKLVHSNTSYLYTNLTNSNPDTALIRLKTDACPNWPEYKVLIFTVNDTTTLVSILNCETICGEEDDKIKMRQAFETEVIDKIKN